MQLSLRGMNIQRVSLQHKKVITNQRMAQFIRSALLVSTRATTINQESSHCHSQQSEAEIIWHIKPWIRHNLKRSKQVLFFYWLLYCFNKNNLILKELFNFSQPKKSHEKPSPRQSLLWIHTARQIKTQMKVLNSCCQAFLHGINHSELQMPEVCKQPFLQLWQIQPWTLHLLTGCCSKAHCFWKLQLFNLFSLTPNLQLFFLHLRALLVCSHITESQWKLPSACWNAPEIVASSTAQC